MIQAPYPHRLLAARLVLALLLAAHGAAHFVAVAGIVGSNGLGRPLELLGGTVVTSNAAVSMLLAIALAAAGTGFVAAAFMLIGREPRLSPLLVAVAVLSLTTTVAGLWGTAVGALIDLAVLTVASGAPALVDAPSPAAF